MPGTVNSSITSTVTQELGKISGFFKAHERLLIVIILAATAFFGYEKYAAHEEAIAKQQATQSAQVLAAQKETDAQLATTTAAAAAQTAAAIAQYQQMVTQLAAQNSQLANQIEQRNQNLKNQQNQNATLDAAGMASRIADDEGFPSGAVTVEADTVVLNNPSAHQILNDLDSVPVLKQNIIDLTATKTNQEKQISGLQDIVAKQTIQISDQAKQIDGLTKALADSEANTIKQVALQKAADRKSKISWFKAGVILGFVGGFFGAHAAGF
jgi:uncharacterized coiled-coil protein SlyX